MLVRTIMTSDPISLAAEASLDDVMRVMDEHEIRHVPIVDGGRLIGVLSDRDMLGATGWLPEALRKDDGKKCARDLLGGKPVTCTADESVVMVAVDLSSRAIGCLPVLEGDKLVGIVTEMDLLSAYLDLSSMENSSVRLHDPVSQYMADEVSTLVPASTLGDALELKRARGVRHLPVVSEQRLVGIISDRDLRKALGRGLPKSTAISGLMANEPLTLDPEEPLSRAASCMLEGKISSLPVVDDGRLVGIVTLDDLLDHCISNLRLPDKK